MERLHRRGAGGLRGPRAASGSPVGDRRSSCLDEAILAPRLVPLRNEDSVLGLLAEVLAGVNARPAARQAGDRLR